MSSSAGHVAAKCFVDVKSPMAVLTFTDIFVLFGNSEFSFAGVEYP